MEAAAMSKHGPLVTIGAPARVARAPTASAPAPSLIPCPLIPDHRRIRARRSSSAGLRRRLAPRRTGLEELRDPVRVRRFEQALAQHLLDVRESGRAQLLDRGGDVVG